MALDHWNKRADGSVEIGPLLGWEVAAATDRGVMRLNYAYDEESRKAGGQMVQVSVTEAQARELAQLLTMMADKVAAARAFPTVQ